ncbi:MAG TPA: MFS transporter, partial [Coxiellaceae bacterium]|nr:MFS transporter [Coxiellaceae bacterium]
MSAKASFIKRCYPWLVWGLGSGFMFYKYLLEVSPSVMVNDLMRVFNATGAQLGNLAGCYFYAYLLMQIPMGIFTDRFGPRRVTSFAIICCAAGALLLAYANELIVAELARFITGFGAAVAAISCLKLTTLWFPPKRFALMAGLMMSIAVLGAVGGQAPLSIVMSHIGWRDSMIYAAVLGFALGFIFWLIVRDHGPHAVQVETPTERPPVFAGLKKILQNRQTWFLSWYSGLAFAPVSVFGGLWGVPYLQEVYGFERTLAAQQISLVFIGFAVGSPIAGWLSSRIGRRLPVMAWGTAAAFIFSLLILYVPNLSVWECGLLLFLFGVGISCFLLCFSMICEVNHLILAATAIGF